MITPLCIRYTKHCSERLICQGAYSLIFEPIDRVIWKKVLRNPWTERPGHVNLAGIMFEKLKLPCLLNQVTQSCEAFPDLRTGTNTQYSLSEVGMSAFAVFFTQSPSFLAHQRTLKLRKGRHNAESLFGVCQVPSDNQVRNLLDPVSPTYLHPVYRHTFLALEQTGVLKSRRSFAQQLLVAIDGTEYFSSTTLQCENCSQRTLKNGKINYFHSVLTPVLVQPGQAQVLALEPEFIVPQDGHEKQDCELQAAKRWVAQHGAFYAERGVTILGDDLFCHQPFCQVLKDAQLHFILVCKPDSHVHLYETVAFLAANQALGTKVVRRWVGGYAEIATYRYTNQLPLSAAPEALEVGWCELTITREDTGAQLYKNAWVTDFEVTERTVEALVRDGRARWKVENEHNNVLKTKGYHLEHNFGHGNQYLAALLLSLNLLAFLFHTVLDLVDEQYRLLRQVLGTRRTFFQDLETLLRYFQFESWAAVFAFMCKGLELENTT